jgi:hypothetical protein
MSSRNTWSTKRKPTRLQTSPCTSLFTREKTSKFLKAVLPASLKFKVEIGCLFQIGPFSRVKGTHVSQKKPLESESGAYSTFFPSEN